MADVALIERILVANEYHRKYSSFDEFYDNQINNSYVVADGPQNTEAFVEPDSEQRSSQKEEMRASLESKYWPQEQKR